jgi:hypothetical protein
LAVLFAAACGEAPATTPGGAAAATLSSANGGRNADDLRPRGVLLSPLRGASGLGTTPELVVVVSCPGVDVCPLDAATMATLLAPRIRLVDGEGVVTPVVPNPKGTPMPTPGGNSATRYPQTFVPAKPLDANTLYALDLASDERAVLVFGDATPEETAAALDARQAAAVQRMRVFSGSRPLPVEVQVSTASGAPVTSARVRFSEPVAVGSLVGNVALTDAAGAVVPSCPSAPPATACAEPSSSSLSDVADLVFATPVSLADLRGGGLSVARTVHGSGRTIGEAAALAGRALEPASGDVTLPLDETQWIACGPTDELACFRDPSARWP